MRALVVISLALAAIVGLRGWVAAAVVASIVVVLGVLGEARWRRARRAD